MKKLKTRLKTINYLVENSDKIQINEFNKEIGLINNQLELEKKNKKYIKTINRVKSHSLIRAQ